MEGCVLVKVLQQNLLRERDLLCTSILTTLIGLLYLNEGQRTCFDAIQLEEYRKGNPPNSSTESSRRNPTAKDASLLLPAMSNFSHSYAEPSATEELVSWSVTTTWYDYLSSLLLSKV